MSTGLTVCLVAYALIGLLFAYAAWRSHQRIERDPYSWQPLYEKNRHVQVSPAVAIAGAILAGALWPLVLGAAVAKASSK